MSFESAINVKIENRYVKSFIYSIYILIIYFYIILLLNMYHYLQNLENKNL